MEKMYNISYLVIIICVVLLDNTSRAYVCSEKTLCSAASGNGACDAICNNLNCSYDNGDCLLESNPWSGCSKTSCRTSFYNDTCDSTCNNEACLYDQLRCKPLFTDDCIENCTNKWGNEVCDSDCNMVQCGYDGNDCKMTGTALSGTMIVYATSSITLPSNTARFIGFSLSMATRTLISVKLSSKYSGNVPEIESLGDAGLRIQYSVQNIPNCNTNTYTVCWSSLQYLTSYGSAVSIVLNNFLKSIGVSVTITKVLACMDGFYGEFCNQACSVNCKSGCQIFDGKCIDGCLGLYQGDKCDTLCSPNCKLGCTSGTTCFGGECNPGYTGIQCTTECSSGTYGSNCASNCSSGCLNNVCDKVIGTCSCSPGYNGTMCEIDCSDSTYGSGCNGTCGNCHYGAACDKVNGTCLAGCSAGFYGVLCLDVCPEGKHGTDCTKNCTNCVNDTCNPKTGACNEGCISGWLGSDCTSNYITVIYNNTNTSTTIAIALIIVACVLVGIAILLVVILCVRRKKNNYQGHLDKEVVIGEVEKVKKNENDDSEKKLEGASKAELDDDKKTTDKSGSQQTTTL